ncbi:energy-coupling factor ABC transporter substrate-binding protein [Lachnospiraceae bacterium 62-35]
MNKIKKAGLLLLICIVIAVVPLILHQDSEFGGSDGKAEDAIAELDPDYEAWASPIMEPPGGETESLLFCLQAAIGAGILGYGFGVLRERARKEKA